VNIYIVIGVLLRPLAVWTTGGNSMRVYYDQSDHVIILVNAIASSFLWNVSQQALRLTGRAPGFLLPITNEV